MEKEENKKCDNCNGTGYIGVGAGGGRFSYHEEPWPICNTDPEMVKLIKTFCDENKEQLNKSIKEIEEMIDNSTTQDWIDTKFHIDDKLNFVDDNGVVFMKMVLENQSPAKAFCNILNNYKALLDFVKYIATSRVYESQYNKIDTRAQEILDSIGVKHE